MIPKALSRDAGLCRLGGTAWSTGAECSSRSASESVMLREAENTEMLLELVCEEFVAATLLCTLFQRINKTFFWLPLKNF